jgi:hypothetical protein
MMIPRRQDHQQRPHLGVRQCGGSSNWCLRGPCTNNWQRHLSSARAAHEAPYEVAARAADRSPNHHTATRAGPAHMAAVLLSTRQTWPRTAPPCVTSPITTTDVAAAAHYATVSTTHAAHQVAAAPYLSSTACRHDLRIATPPATHTAHPCTAQAQSGATESGAGTSAGGGGLPPCMRRGRGWAW